MTGFLAAEIRHISCDQQGKTDYTIAFEKDGTTRTVQVFATTDPAARKNLHLVATTGKTSVTVHAGSSNQRMYFLLKPDHGHPREVSLRRLPLEGTPNFRDLGGYETSNGRFLRWGSA